MNEEWKRKKEEEEEKKEKDLARLLAWHLWLGFLLRWLMHWPKRKKKKKEEEERRRRKKKSEEKRNWTLLDAWDAGAGFAGC
jgi:uncharacterized Rmd1/YagE family protein